MSALVLLMIAIGLAVWAVLTVTSPQAIKRYCIRGILFAEWRDWANGERKTRRARWSEIKSQRESELHAQFGVKPVHQPYGKREREA